MTSCITNDKRRTITMKVELSGNRSAIFSFNHKAHMCFAWTLIIPNGRFLVRFGGIRGEFGGAMVLILARRIQAKIAMTRTNEPDIPLKRVKEVRLGVYRTQIQNLALR